MKRVSVLSIISVAFIVLNANGQDLNGLNKYVDGLAEKILSRPVAGVSIAIARNGRLIFARGYGLANAEHSVAVTPQTVFHICSISKNILAATLLQLVDQGKLKLDDDVTKYVPEAPTQGHKVTVQQLLNHTSGIFSFTSLPEAETNERFELSHEQVLGLIKNRPFDFEPGTRWRYDDSAFYIAGMVVERVTGQEYGAYVREQLFTPLGMESAQMCDARMVVPHLASGYERDQGKLVNAAFLSWKLPSAAGAICATPTDLLKWQSALDSGRVLSASSMKLMRAPTRLSDGTVIDYGLGTRLGLLEGHRMLGHTGSGGGFGAALVDLPDDHLTIVVLLNTANAAGLALATASAIARKTIGLPITKVVRDLPVPPAELKSLLGTYDSDEGTVENFEKDGKLNFRSVAGGEGVLLRQAENVYAIDENLEVHFLVRNGRAIWGIVYIGGMLMDPNRRIR